MDMLFVGIGIAILVVFLILIAVVIITGRPKTGEEVIEEIDELGEGEEPFDFSYREIYCPECGEIVDPEDDECPFCGAVFEEDIYECPECGGEVDPREAVCPHCGGITQVEATVCPECGAVVPPDAIHCDACGEDFWSPVKLEEKKPRPKPVDELIEEEYEEEE